MEDSKNFELKREELEGKLEQLQEKLDALIDEKRKIDYYDSNFENREREIRQKIRQTFQEMDIVHDKIRLFGNRLVACNEILDVYLDYGSVKKGYGNFEIYLHGTPNRIGYVRLIREPNNPYGNVAYVLDEEYRGHRFALQSLELLKDTMLKLKIVKPIITVEPDNIASVRTIQNFGGVLTQNHGWYDTYEVDLTKEESPKKR